HVVAVGRKARREVVERTVVWPRAIAADKEDELLNVRRGAQRFALEELRRDRGRGGFLDLARPELGERDRRRRTADATRRWRPAIVRARREGSGRKEGQGDERSTSKRASKHAGQSTEDGAQVR